MKNLISFIESHEGCRVHSTDGNKLTVSSVVVLADGTVTRETQTIAATLQSIRDWLGY